MRDIASENVVFARCQGVVGMGGNLTELGVNWSRWVEFRVRGGGDDPWTYLNKKTASITSA